ncbi:MAG: 50S ribosomal protein L21 [Ignavibacteria bacterium]|nr:50S ribosomal protein L21 [Ignavibacteria bacterium]
MFAIVEIKGYQFRVQENQNIYVPKLKEEPGKKVEFKNVLMFSPDDKSFVIGTPTLKKKVKATVIEHVKDDKLTVFKKKRRKGYKVRKGHRQQYTKILIDKISEVREKRSSKNGT